MQTQLGRTIFTFLLLFSSPTFFVFSTASPPSKNNRSNNAQALVRSSCVHTRYPNICLKTLSNYAGPANSPLDVARAALRVSLAHARRACRHLKTLQAPLVGSGPGPNKGPLSSKSKRQRAALSDCIEQMADSVDELKRSLEELQHLETATFRWQMSNAQTWVSAALSNGDSCLDGFGDGSNGGDRGGGGNDRDKKLGRSVKRRVTDVARVTSNALYMINLVGETWPGSLISIVLRHVAPISMTELSILLA
ncbi:hypothetical protein HN51_012154 [Arachis hypogaea]|uniref:Pectinesterase inhibitor domain-containing protein n=1 Tax=Arachis hypogaea TaxID=3818 RepID=A0A445DW00_ARAHY|nr:pectinesterase inhibitor 3 [Arachis hypogaea]QHO57598.1 uncharacterized protein DS421_3g83590 [Arachis hypogaea]RYR67359.1 hypothetical protein Ahy_A03g013693 isoform B [Arachis hypogaea]